jgi:regulator of sirC expression with transglutaminase-like and TPR domain
MEGSNKKRYWPAVVAWTLVVLGVFLALIMGVILGVMQLAGYKGLVSIPVLVGGFAAGALLVASAALIMLSNEIYEAQTELRGRLHLMQNTLRSQQTELAQISENILLSDKAKEVAFREKERRTLRKAIEEDLEKRDWEGAELLIDRMQNYFGYRGEAEQYRKRLEEAKESARNEEIDQAVKRVEGLMERYEWESAARQIKQLLSLFPNDDRVKALPEELEDLRQRRKRHLLAAWDEAVHRNEIDRSIDLLKELDPYLTPNEAEGLRESVKGVFKAKLRNLGVQFSIAVSEKAWEDALKIGRQLIEEFPNSRMAQEVRDRIDVLQQLAEGEEFVPPPTPPV